jgi:hypothetical protein
MNETRSLDGYAASILENTIVDVEAIASNGIHQGVTLSFFQLPRRHKSTVAALLPQRVLHSLS